MFRLQFIIFLLCTCLSGQNLKFKTYLTENGLSNNSVTSIIVDKNASLWIGTWDGLNFYDGHKFIVFKHLPEDSTSISGNFINDCVVDKDKRIWFLTDGNSISLLQKNNTFQNFEFKQTPSKIGLNVAHQLLVKSENKTLIFNGNKFISCKNCKFYEDDSYWKNTLHSYFPNIKVNTILKDKSGNIWIGTFKNGLFYIPANKIPNLQKSDIEQYTKDIYNKFGLSSNEIETIKEDHFGNIWIGTKDGGIMRVYTNSEQIFYVSQHPELQPNLPNETIRAISVDNETLWLGYYTKGLFRKNKNSDLFEKYPLKKDQNWNRIRSLYKASDGSIFGGTYAGVFRIKNGKIRYYASEDTPFLVNNRNYAFHENDQKQIYVACWDGVSLFDLEKDTFIPFHHQALLNSYHVRDIFEWNGKLYLATERNGLVVFDGNKIQNVAKKQGLADDSVYTIWYEEANHQLWLGTLGGIDIYDIKKQKVIKNLSEKDGLPSHLVYGILGTENYLWCSTTKGLATIDKNTYDIFPHPAEEGFQSKEFSEGAYYKDSKGILYFGGVNGLNYFNR